MNSTVHKKIYKSILASLSGNAMSRSRLIESVVAELYGDAVKNDGTVGEFTDVRGMVGYVVNEMRGDGVITEDGGLYVLSTTTPMALKIIDCEKNILSYLQGGSKNKQQIRSYLRRIYGTDKTKTEKDDRMLYEHIGQILRRMLSERTIRLENGRYRLTETVNTTIDSKLEMLDLKNAFISKIHRGGGEFFEHFIMTLLSKYAEKYGKRVVEAKTTGGSADGGIDGIIKTIDPLGFRETVMIQAKNRTDMTTETTVRSFYGALCASGGTHGIFACMSDFHASAKLFLAGLDNCVGLSGDDIFRIACECLYGIKKKSGRLVIDNKIL